MNEQQHIGELIKKARTEKKISQGKLAKLLSVQNPVIYKYESGIVKTIPFDKRIMLSAILNIDIDNLLYEQEKETTFVDSMTKLKTVYDAVITLKERAIKKQLDNHRDASLLYVILKIAQLAFNNDDEELEPENAKRIYYEEFLKRGLSENDALDLAKFFAWLCIKQPRVLSQWHDIMLKEKLDTENK